MKNFVSVLTAVFVSFLTACASNQMYEDSKPSAGYNNSNASLCQMTRDYFRYQAFGQSQKYDNNMTQEQIKRFGSNIIGVVCDSESVDASTMTERQLVRALANAVKNFQNDESKTKIDSVIPKILEEILNFFGIKDPAHLVNEIIRIVVSARVLVPGWAQIYKSQTAKGAAFIVGEIILVGGITSFGLKAYYEDRMNNTHNLKAKQRFSDKANACNIAGYISVGLAASLYLWNIIDGAVSEPYNYGNRVSFMPVATPDSFELAMNLRF